MQLALGDALAIALLESRGFTAVDFGLLHPGGKLGALLKTVRDLMHTGAEVPLAPLGTRMSDALIEMTRKGFGCVGIVDDDGLLVGIITDGDLRRHMRNDLLDASVDEVMTRKPKTVRPDQLISETLELLNSMKVTALFADRGRPAGRRHPRPRSACAPARPEALSAAASPRPPSPRRSVGGAPCGPSTRHRPAADRRGQFRLAAGEDRDQRHAERGGEMHQPGIDADRPTRRRPSAAPPDRAAARCGTRARGSDRAPCARRARARRS